MQYQELITNVCGDKPPVLLTTATTGVKPEDTLIAAFSIDLSDRSTSLVMRHISNELLAPAAQYHGIMEQEMRSFAMPEDLVKRTLEELFAEHTVFSYNPVFQTDFIGRFLGDTVSVVDLPAIVQAADMRTSRLEGDSPAQLEASAMRLIDKPPAFRAICRRYGLQPRAFLLPLQASGWQLDELWARLSEIPVPEPQTEPRR